MAKRKGLGEGPGASSAMTPSSDVIRSSPTQSSDDIGEGIDGEAFSRAFSAALRQQGATGASVARKLGTSRSYVSALQNAKKTPSAEAVDRIASALSLGPEESTSLHRAAARSHGFRLDLPEEMFDSADRCQGSGRIQSPTRARSGSGSDPGSGAES